MTNLEEYHLDFQQSLLNDAESRGLMLPQSFFEIVCEDLVTVGDLSPNYTAAEYIKRGIEVYGYDHDTERKILTILNHQFFQEDQIQTLTKAQIDTKFARLKTFFNKCVGELYHSLEETSEAYSMAYNICKYAEKDQFNKVRLMILSDGIATRNLSDIPAELVGDTQFEFRVIDIEYLHKIFLSGSKNAPFEIKIDLPYLKVNDESGKYQSYLSVIRGDQLVKIYEDHGQKLFEQNVRTFLQFKGNVNKGMRNTIELAPEMFFAYNNGITATASSIDLNEQTGKIQRITNFQIVNGGQTTSAIYAASKKSNLDVSTVAVQMKLSVVMNTEAHDEFMSKVTEYANTQNKINNSDFFSNSPFHKEMKAYSSKIYAPPIGGSQRRTHWYYERVRGEYLNSQAYLSKEEKKRFQLENPKAQVVDKTLLSKTENVWRQQPYIVAKGAQDSFKAFSENITEALEKDNLVITETYFKNAIARVILFRSTERLITKSKWYDGGYRAQTVAYTISYLSAFLQKSGLFLNFDLIWENQSLPAGLVKILELMAQKVYGRITAPAAGYANIAQYAKTAGCWENVRQMEFKIEAVDSATFIDSEEKKYTTEETRSDPVREIVIENIEPRHWMLVLDHYNDQASELRLPAVKLSILSRMALGQIPAPSEQQSKILCELYSAAVREGVKLEFQY